MLEAVESETLDGAWAAGFVSYEAAPGFDPSLSVFPARAGRVGVPAAWFGIFESAEEAAPVVPASPGAYTTTEWRSETDGHAYEAKVDVLRGLIAAGETYQCNLTVRLRAAVTGDLAALYADLASAQQAAYCAEIDTGRFAVLCASPELFFEWSGGQVTTRPMKGTAPRGRFPAEDDANASALLASEKDRAENLMIVDLLRNDLGRVAAWGGVEVTRLFELERYTTVWQLTSTVSARLRQGVGLVELFRALFPSGSVTGAPKPRTTALIAGLEESPRGVYCGAVGFVAPQGHEPRARFSVPIRTATVDRRTGEAEYGTGSGITWGSNAKSEAAELEVKSRILTRLPELALVETMAFLPGRGVRNVRRHMARLGFSAGRLGFVLDEGAVSGAIEEATCGLVLPSRLRLTLTRAGEVDVKASAMPATGPVRLAVSDMPMDSSDLLVFHKTTLREPYLTRAACHPQADDVVLVNELGRPTETTIANLLVRLDGRWWTPPIDAGCLPGVERGRLVADGVVAERDLSLGDLTAADELAVVSSLRGWRTAHLVTTAAG